LKGINGVCLKVIDSVSDISGTDTFRKLLRRAVSFLLIPSAFMVISGTAYAESFSQLLPEVLENHDRINAAETDLYAANDGIDIATGDYLPTVSLSAEKGYEYQNKPTGSDDTSTGYSQLTLGASQLLWDVNKTFVSIDKSKLAASSAELRLASAKQDIIRESLSAYLNLVKAYNTYNYALQSEQNIKEQTGLEEALVAKNSGLASDLLQAKSSLAGAQANRIQANGNLTIALNRYRNVFKHDPSDLKTLAHPRLPVELLPASLQEATVIAQKHNLSLKIASVDVDIAQATNRIDELSLWGGTINLVGESNFKRNAGGTLEDQIEHIIKLEASVPLFNGGKDQATYYQTLNLKSTAFSHLSEQQYVVEEQVNNAWQAYETFQATSEVLRNQANIAGEFLEIARQERKLGNRSLIDILTAETTFINALSSAEAAETSVALAAYDLIFAMGQLNAELF